MNYHIIPLVLSVLSGGVAHLSKGSVLRLGRTPASRLAVLDPLPLQTSASEADDAVQTEAGSRPRVQSEVV